MKQASFFNNIEAMGQIVPEGLRYINSYITYEEQGQLLKMVNRQNWLSDLKRRVQHYGYKYDYKSRKISSDLYLGRLPDWLLTYANKLAEDGIFKKPPNQVIINEYLAGQGIAPHTDCVPCFGGVIASLSLGSGCAMDFTKQDVKYTQYLEVCSLVIMQGEARYDWKHAIAPRRSDKLGGASLPRLRRTSLTFREVLT
jgi:alkylated DNA repair dioxygenase AlkB